ncbi:hypothetical protein Tco_0722576 [Tanacetum coccineum]
MERECFVILLAWKVFIHIARKIIFAESKAEVGVGDFIELKVTDCVQTKKKLKLVISLKLSLKMDLSDYEVPRVLVTCRRQQIYDENDDENVSLYYHINKDFSIPFGRKEFCLVSGLGFRVQNWAEYDTKQSIPFRRWVFPSYLDGQPITGNDIANFILDESFAQLYDDDAVDLCCLGILQLVILGVESKRVVPDWMLRLANDREAWDKYPCDSYVWPTLYSQLRNAVLKHWSPLYVDEPTDEDDSKKYSIFGYTWAFKTWILESYRVTVITYFDRYNRYSRVAAWNKKKGRFLEPMVIPFFEGNMSAARLTPDTRNNKHAEVKMTSILMRFPLPLDKNPLLDHYQPRASKKKVAKRQLNGSRKHNHKNPYKNKRNSVRNDNEFDDSKEISIILGTLDIEKSRWEAPRDYSSMIKDLQE